MCSSSRRFRNNSSKVQRDVIALDDRDKELRTSNLRSGTGTPTLCAGSMNSMSS